MVIIGIIAQPDFKKIAENKESFGLWAALLQKGQKQLSDCRVFRI